MPQVQHCARAATFTTRAFANARHPSGHRWRIVYLMLLLAAVLTPLAYAAEGSGTQSEALDAVHADRVPEKLATLCGSDGSHCTGRWADLIDHLFTFDSGHTSIFVSPGLEAEIVAKGFCTLGSGKFIHLRDQGGAERVLLSQLYISYAMGSKLTLRMGADSTTGECYLMYTRALYNEP